MKPFFDTQEKKAAFIQEARSWIGTPFRAYAGVKRAGTDCVHFVAACYVAAGLLKGFYPPRYRVQDGDFLSDSAIETFIDEMGCFADLLLEDHYWPARVTVMTGDCVCIQMGRVSHHVGVVTVEDLFVHSYQTVGVVECSLRDPTWRNRVKKIYRPVV